MGEVIPAPFIESQDMELPHNLDLNKGFDGPSEEIIALNDTENEILVPECMQVIPEGEGGEEIY